MLLAGCSSSSGTEAHPSFWPSGTPTEPDQARLAAGTTTPDSLTVLVQVIGPTSASDVAGFSFDLLVSDPAVLDYVDGSATAGPALDPDGTAGVSVEVVHDAQRVSVVVRRTDGSGSEVAPGAATVVALRYGVRRGGTSAVQFAPDPAPAALDSDGAPVPSIAFDMVPSAIAGP